MQRVTTVNLNGNAHQVEEGAYDALVAYLNRARTLLENNPDRAEIIADLEQAIAEKCSRFLGPHKTVITADDMEQVLKEMGPVEPAAGAPGEARTASQPGGAEGTPKGASDREPQKRLYQLRNGAMLAGVCNGLAAYLGIDVNIVRVVFVVLTGITHGAWAIVYVAIALLLPAASTPEEQAAAHGAPFNAQELIDRAKANSTELRDKKWWKGRNREWRREWRRMRRQQSWGGTPPAPAAGYAWHPVPGMMAPVFTLIEIAFLVAFVLAIVSLVNTGAVFGFVPPTSMPLWAGILVLFVIYQILVSPFRAARHAYATAYGPAAAWNAQFGWIIALVVFWFLYTNLPEVREFVRNLPQIVHDVTRDLTH
jgi:phage shock protein PspC (stress-responsive transcriptional regulator)